MRSLRALLFSGSAAFHGTPATATVLSLGFLGLSLLISAPLAPNASAQFLTIGGFLEAEHYNFDRVDADSSVSNLDFVIDGRLDIDAKWDSKIGITLGAHLELDLEQSDHDQDGDDGSTGRGFDPLGLLAGLPLTKGLVEDEDALDQDLVAFNDGYLYLDSALGLLALGDTGPAGFAENQLQVPLLAHGAMEIDAFNEQEGELAYYSNSAFGLDFDGAVDDDGRWSAGAAYTLDLTGLDITLGTSFATEGFAFSLHGDYGPWQAGVSYADTSFDSDLSSRFGLAAGTIVAQARDYLSLGLSYQLGPLTLGGGYELQNMKFASITPFWSKQSIGSYHAGAAYELAPGLTLATGLAYLDPDVGTVNSDFMMDLGDGSQNDNEISIKSSVRVDF